MDIWNGLSDSRIEGTQRAPDRTDWIEITKQLQLTQEETPVIDDQAASNYFDIGTMRIQWGTISYALDDPTAMTLPASFANTNFSVLLSLNVWDYNAEKGPSDVSNGIAVIAKSTTTFTVNRDNDLANDTIFDWLAIGLKP